MRFHSCEARLLALTDAAADILGRNAVPRQIERVNRALGGERLVVEQPIVEIAAEAVHQDHRHTVFAA